MDIGYSGPVFTNDHSIYFLPPWLPPLVLFPASVVAFPAAAPKLVALWLVVFPEPVVLWLVALF